VEFGSRSGAGFGVSLPTCLFGDFSGGFGHRCDFGLGPGVLHGIWQLCRMVCRWHSDAGAFGTTLLGPRNAAVPPFVGLSPDTGHPPYGSPGLPGFLGISNSAFRPSGPAQKDMVLNGIDAARLEDRRSLLRSVDRLREICSTF